MKIGFKVSYSKGNKIHISAARFAEEAVTKNKQEFKRYIESITKTPITLRFSIASDRARTFKNFDELYENFAL